MSVDQVPHVSHKTRQSPPQRRRFFNLQCVPSCQERKLDYTVRTYMYSTVHALSSRARPILQIGLNGWRARCDECVWHIPWLSHVHACLCVSNVP